MASGKLFFALLFVVSASNVEGSGLIERSYEYVLSLGKNLAPSFMSLVDCMSEDDIWACAKLKAGKLLDSWNEDLDKQRRSWQVAADAEISHSGRTIEEMPSKLGREVETSLNSIAELVQHSVARAHSRKHESGGIDSITISTSDKKKKEKKKKKKPSAGLHVVQMPVMMERKPAEKGRSADRPVQTWVIGHDSLRHLGDNPEPEIVDSNLEAVDSNSEMVDSSAELVDSNVEMANSSRKGRGFLEDAWSIGEKALDSIAEDAVDSDNAENGFENDKSSLDEQRGKKKKKKKAILKLLLLGAVLKAKIGTLLQILSFKLQVKFFIIALVGLAINLARFWIDVKHKHHQQPQKVIYYEHAQHQHHYDEHEESPGWGPWSRSMDPEQQDTDVELDLDLQNSPYRVQERNTIIRPAPSRS